MGPTSSPGPPPPQSFFPSLSLCPSFGLVPRYIALLVEMDSHRHPLPRWASRLLATCSSWGSTGWLISRCPSSGASFHRIHLSLYFDTSLLSSLLRIGISSLASSVDRCTALHASARSRRGSCDPISPGSRRPVLVSPLLFSFALRSRLFSIRALACHPASAYARVFRHQLRRGVALFLVLPTSLGRDLVRYWEEASVLYGSASCACSRRFASLAYVV